MIIDSTGKRAIKLLIVDDEPVICQGLRHTIDWAALGIEVIGEAYDGEEALGLVRERGADIVLSDIRMDGMDGLKLAQLLKQEFPDTRVVMISGYEDFDYARQAMRMGVTDYLLKPVEIEELVSVVEKITRELHQEEQASASDENVLWLTGMVHHTPASAQMLPPQQLRGVAYRVIASQAMDFYEGYGRLSLDAYSKVQQQWMQLLEVALSAQGIRSLSLFSHDNLLYTLAISEQALEDHAWRLLLEKALSEWTGEHALYCGVSTGFTQLEKTGERSAEAHRIVQYHVVEQRTVLLRADVTGRSKASQSDIDYKAKVERIVAALFKQDAAEVEETVRAIFTSLEQRGLLLYEAVQVYDELLVLLRQRLRQSGLSDMEFNRRSPMDIHEFNSYRGITGLGLEEMKHLLQVIDENGIDKSYWIIEKAKSYIIEQFDHDLKASEVAAWLKITPSYFSYIFKQSTGKTFKEYMTSLRIEKAKELLATTHDKVFEISDQVGYKEYKYFVMVFKSYTGMTPKEYRTLNATS